MLHFFEKESQSIFDNWVHLFSYLSWCCIDNSQEEEEKEEEELSRIIESKVNEEDVALKEMITPTALEAQEQARARTLEKQEQLCELSRALAVLASASVRTGEFINFC